MIMQINKDLNDKEKSVLFDGATETPFTGELLDEHRDGSFTCKNCGHLLFKSDTKFDSGSGWPSFTEPANRENVRLIPDTTHGMSRIEVRCANCDGHLGHVFPDGPSDRGGQRFCINSASLSFNPEKTDE